MKTLLAAGLALSALLAVLLGALPARAQEGGRAQLSDLAWMEGRWRGQALGGTVEEIWSAPEGGGMMGMFRLVGENGKVSLYEFLLIEEGQRGLELRFKHYGPGYVPWEKETALTFEIESWDERRVQFVSAEDQQSPTHMLYSHPDDDRMLVTVQTVREGREPESFDVMYKRVAD